MKGNEQEVEISKILMHPRFNVESLRFNVALIRLAAPVQLGDCVGVACLPEAEQDALPSMRCFTTGWSMGPAQRGAKGLPSHREGFPVLQEAEMELVDQDVCQRKWANHPTNPQQIHAESVCVGPVGKDTATVCHGDSGGPLVCETTSGWTVFGSTSFADFKGDECSSKEYPNVYVRMHAVSDWIQEVTADLV